MPITGSPAKTAAWSLLEVARPGTQPVPYGILLADADDALVLRLMDEPPGERALDENEEDIFAALAADLEMKGREAGARALLQSLEDGASNYFRVTDREQVEYRGSAKTLTDRLFREHVTGHTAEVIPFVTHLPLYGLRAAATKFGESMEAEQEGWIAAPERLRLTEGMFVAQVVGRSMEPRIPDGSYCVFRAPVTGSRQGRLVLVEKFDEADFASRFTVKRYARHGARDESAERTDKITLEPLNREFEAFTLDEDKFQVIAEFVQVIAD